MVVADLSAAGLVTRERRARALLALGATAGLAAAVATLVGGPALPVSADAVAVVNGVPIRRDDYLRALAGVASDRREPIDATVEEHVLNRLIDEELLVQRGLELGLPRRDRTLRGQLVTAAIDLLARSTVEPSDADLRTFFEAHPDYFEDPGRVRVRQVFVRTEGRPEDEARTRAEDAARRLRAGEAFDTVAAALGDDPVASIPDTLLPAEKLRDYVGETATRAVLQAGAGGITDPVRSSMGYHVLVVAEATEPAVPPFDGVVDRVRAEYRRRADDATLRAALDQLRHAAHIRTADTLP